MIERPQLVKAMPPSLPLRAVQIKPQPQYQQLKQQFQPIKYVQPMNFQRPNVRVVNAAPVAAPIAASQPRSIIVNPQIV